MVYGMEDDSMSKHAGGPSVHSLVYECAGQDGAGSAVAHETWHEAVAQSDEGAERVEQGRQINGAALENIKTLVYPKMQYYPVYYPVDHM